MYTSVAGLDVAAADGVLWLQLARPAKRNAIDDTMMYGLIDAVDTAGRDEAFAMELSSRSEDFKIGMRALVDRQAPVFTGR